MFFDNYEISNVNIPGGEDAWIADMSDRTESKLLEGHASPYSNAIDSENTGGNGSERKCDEQNGNEVIPMETDTMGDFSSQPASSNGSNLMNYRENRGYSSNIESSSHSEDEDFTIEECTSAVDGILKSGKKLEPMKTKETHLTSDVLQPRHMNAYYTDESLSNASGGNNASAISEHKRSNSEPRLSDDAVKTFESRHSQEIEKNILDLLTENKASLTFTENVEHCHEQIARISVDDGSDVLFDKLRITDEDNQNFNRDNNASCRSRDQVDKPEGISAEETEGNLRENHTMDKAVLEMFLSNDKFQPTNINSLGIDQDHKGCQSFSEASLKDFEFPDNEEYFSSHECISSENVHITENERFKSASSSPKGSEKTHFHLDSQPNKSKEGKNDRQLYNEHTAHLNRHVEHNDDRLSESTPFKGTNGTSITEENEDVNSEFYGPSDEDKKEIPSPVKGKRVIQSKTKFSARHYSDTSSTIERSMQNNSDNGNSSEEAVEILSKEDENRSFKKSYSKRGANTGNLEDVQRAPVEVHADYKKKGPNRHYRDDKLKMSSAAPVNLVYIKRPWEVYIKDHIDLPDWDADEKDPLAQVWAREINGGEKKFYRDINPVEPIEECDEGIRGWNVNEYMYTSTMSSATDSKRWSEDNRAYHPLEVSTQKYQTGENQLKNGGAKPKKHQGRYSERVASVSDSDVRDNESADYHDVDYDKLYQASPATGETTMINDSDCPPQFVSEDDSSEDENYEGSMRNVQEYYIHDRRTHHPSEQSILPRNENAHLHRSYYMIEYLSKQANFSSKLKSFLQHFESHEPIMEIVQGNPHIFHLSGNLVELKPQITMCHNYLSEDGCYSKATCSEIHICERYLLNTCMDDCCPLGHSLHTGHNKKVLKRFCLENLNPNIVKQIVQSKVFEADTQNQTQEIEICNQYNNGNCRNKDCLALHICLDYVVGLGTCYRPSCSLRHNLHESCSKLLTYYGIKTSDNDENEAALEIVNRSPKLKQMAQAYVYGNEMVENSRNQLPDAVMMQSTLQKRPNKDTAPFADTTTDNNHDNSSEFAKNVTTIFSKFTETFSGANNHEKLGTNRRYTGNFGTVWSHYSGGDTDILEICYKALNNVCEYEETGCKRLHCKLPFHWQVKTREDVGWINLQEHQVIHLENWYCDPSNEGTHLPPVEKSKRPQNLYNIMGKDKRYANFIFMKLVNTDETEIFGLRRLPLQEVEHNSQRCNYLWYFTDAYSWIKYGDVEIQKSKKKFVRVGAEELEKRYKNGGKKLFFRIPNNFNKYELDFEVFFQTNVETKVRREVRRRPEPPKRLASHGSNKLSPVFSPMTCV